MRLSFRVRGIFLGLSICLALALASAGAAAGDAADDVFATTSVHTFSIELAEQAVAALKDVTQQGNTKTYVRARVLEGGRTYEDVGVRLKGNASFRPLADRPCLTLKFDQFRPGQRFHGLAKIHLNNSQSDDSFTTLILCAELFEAAGVPADRGTYARLKINDQDRGLYILNEGFDKRFLKRHFRNTDGNFYEAGVTQDITEPLRRTSGAEPDEYAALRSLADAAREPDLSKRMRRLAAKLDLDRFFSMLAMEALTWHWDGYGMNRNNYRVYHDRVADKLVFCVHGMDQMFWEPRGPVRPPMRGLVARALLEIPEGRRLYHERMSQLAAAVFKPEALSRRVDELRRTIRPVLAPDEPQAGARSDPSLDGVKSAVLERAASVSDQLKLPLQEPIAFKDGQASPSGWRGHDPSNAAVLDRDASGDVLHIGIRSGHDSPAAASWRTRVEIPPGKYRFEGRLRTSGVQPASDEKEDAAELRATCVVLGLGRYQFEELRPDPTAAARPSGVVPAQASEGPSWRQVHFDFEVGADPCEIDLVCELRAAHGEAWFDCDSFRLRKK